MYISEVLDLTRMQTGRCFALIKLELENNPIIMTQTFHYTDESPKVVRQCDRLHLAHHRRWTAVCVGEG